MIWTDQYNDMLIREMYLFEPWKHKKGSSQQGNVWEQISASLNDLHDPKFGVTQKPVRDHYNLLEKQQKKRMRYEEKASGISPDQRTKKNHAQKKEKSDAAKNIRNAEVCYGIISRN